MTLELPWPPSVNHYWFRNRNGGMRVGEAGKDFRVGVCLVLSNMRPRVNPFGGKDRLRATIDAYPPDRRRRDLDNVQKAIFDSLQYAGLYEDDSQIDEITIRRCPTERDGLVRVTVEATGSAL